ncbi:MAG: hypothetical protein HY777_11600 [Betaproteobacteria bacterium]|nr:hypothetical protein [Betaproteobacteria bacterium]
MPFTKHACLCRNCFRLPQGCEKEVHDGCPDHEHRHQGIQRQLQVLDGAVARTLLGGVGSGNVIVLTIGDAQVADSQQFGLRLDPLGDNARDGTE